MGPPFVAQYDKKYVRHRDDVCGTCVTVFTTSGGQYTGLKLQRRTDAENLWISGRTGFDLRIDEGVILPVQQIASV